MAARPQWYFSSIGSMNSVQPYCRLAIITMQMMPSRSWPHRVHAEAAVETVSDVVMILTPRSCMAFSCYYNSHERSKSLYRETRRDSGTIVSQPEPVD